jgi:hypothetical protein
VGRFQFVADRFATSELNDGVTAGQRVYRASGSHG